MLRCNPLLWPQMSERLVSHSEGQWATWVNHKQTDLFRKWDLFSVYVCCWSPEKSSLPFFICLSGVNTALRELTCFQSFKQSNYIQNTGITQKDYTYYCSHHTNTKVLGRLICVMKSRHPPPPKVGEDLKCQMNNWPLVSVSVFFSLSVSLSLCRPLAQSDVSLQHMGSLSECTVSVLTPFLITPVNDWSPGPGRGNRDGSPARALMAGPWISSVVGNGSNGYLQMAWELRD